MQIRLDKKNFLLEEKHIQVVVQEKFAPLAASKKVRSIHLLTSTELPHPAYPEDTVVIHMPGEYEVQGVSIEALQAFRQKNKNQTSLELSYFVNLEGTHVFYLHSNLSSVKNEQFDHISEAHVLILPVDDFEHPGIAAAIKNLEPRIIIPYSTKQNQTAITAFCKSRGVTPPPVVDSFEVNVSSLSETEEKVVLLG